MRHGDDHANELRMIKKSMGANHFMVHPDWGAKREEIVACACSDYILRNIIL